MPAPSAAARAKDQARNAGMGSYTHNGREKLYIHVGHLCSCCWMEMTKETSNGNGSCEACMIKGHEIPCPQWTEDMKIYYEKYQYLNRGEFNLETRVKTRENIKLE